MRQHTPKQLEKLAPQTHEEGGYTIVYNCNSYSIADANGPVAGVTEEYWHDPLTMRERARAKVGLSITKEPVDG